MYSVAIVRQYPSGGHGRRIPLADRGAVGVQRTDGLVAGGQWQRGNGAHAGFKRPRPVGGPGPHALQVGDQNRLPATPGVGAGAVLQVALQALELNAALVGRGDELQPVGVGDRHTGGIDAEDVHDGLRQFVQHFTDVVVAQERAGEASHGVGEVVSNGHGGLLANPGEDPTCRCRGARQVPNDL